MVIHQVGAVVVQLGVVAIRGQGFVDEHQPGIRAVGDAALGTRRAARAAGTLAIAGIDDLGYQQIIRAQQVIPDLIDIETIGGAIGFPLAANHLQATL